MQTTVPESLYIVLVSVHGLVRGQNQELGRDADTGGQIKYVVELANALARHPQVGRVDLFTRQIFDPKVGPDYAAATEDLDAPGARIVRLACGPRKYLRKEVLWPYLEQFVDNALQYLRGQRRAPHLIHSHYADAGFVGVRLAGLLGVPLVHTGHSLGRDKYRRLRDHGVNEDAVEKQFSLKRRIEAEEITLGHAALVVASTQQERDQQYRQYENYHATRMAVIPPGVDLSQFRPPRRATPSPAICDCLKPFLADMRKPMILALSRPDARKNIASLVDAYGQNPELQQLANLVVVAGNRDDIAEMDRGSREVLTDLLLRFDRYNLYGKVAYPKHHRPQDVADFYRAAAFSKGVFVNPALAEPFGLTLLEAAASGLPVLATHDGGPRDIMRVCKNGELFDPLDVPALGEALRRALSQPKQWQQWSRNGLRGAAQFSWEQHVASYLHEVRRVIQRWRHRHNRNLAQGRNPLIDMERFLICDIDNTLLGDPVALKRLVDRLRAERPRLGFGVATGRRLNSALQALEEAGVPLPDVLITGVGSTIHYGHRMMMDQRWHEHIDYRWYPDSLRAALNSLPGLKLQPKLEQNPFKLSYYLDPLKAPPLAEIRRLLRAKDLHAKLIFSHGEFLDLLPIRASKGLAIRYLVWRWGLNSEQVLVAGDSGNDEEMLSGNSLGVVVGNYSPELEGLRGHPRVYFAHKHCAAGILEGLKYYNFLGRQVRPHDNDEED